MNFCQPSGFYRRFKTHEINIGGLLMGAENPIRIQSMVNTPTDNISGTVLQIKKLSDAGCEMARITIRNRADIQSLKKIKQVLRNEGYSLPLVADVHFSARIALEVAEVADKVRINPGNYSDISKASLQKSFTEEEYKLGLEKAYEKVLPLINICKKNGTALRVGVNHGSLAWRVVEKYGNTPKGMVESAMEFLRIFEAEGFLNAVVSMKASNPFTMIHATRLLVQTMSENKMTFPLHLGVTEAGFGSEGIYRSCIGIGSLLCDGIGDTIRVSLSGDPVKEIPACKDIISQYSKIVNNKPAAQEWPFDPFKNKKSYFGKELKGKKIILPAVLPFNKEFNSINSDGLTIHELRARISKRYAHSKSPLFLHSKESAGVKQAIITGCLMADKLFAGWLVPEKDIKGYTEILRSSGQMPGATNYVSCPTCGRTSYDLEAVAKEVKKRTVHFKNLKIAVMGCIVNGPGEMEDADYGILGEQKGRVSIYKGKKCILKGISEKDAASQLESIIRKDKGL